MLVSEFSIFRYRLKGLCKDTDIPENENMFEDEDIPKGDNMSEDEDLPEDEDMSKDRDIHEDEDMSEDSNTPEDETSASHQFNGKQRLVIVCSLYGIRVTAPVLHDNWFELDQNELDELAQLLPSSPLFQANKAIDHKCLNIWLQQMKFLFKC